MALLDIFEGMNPFGARPSEALMGVLPTDADKEKLKNQALMSGLLGTAATYLAQPKNQNLGLGTILGKSYLGGMQSSQGAYDAALKNKIDALNITKTQKQIDMEGMTDPQKLLYAKNNLKTSSPTYNEDLATINKALEKATNTPEQYTGGQKLLAQYNSLDTNSPTYAADKAYLEKLMAMELQNKGTNVVTNVNSGVPFGQEIQTATAKSIISKYDTLSNAPQDIASLRQAKELAKGNPFIGSFGDKKLAVAQFFNNNFGTQINPDALANAKTMGSVLFNNVAAQLKKMDATPTENQQRLMTEAFGNINTDPQALPKILDIYENIITQKVNQHNNMVKSLKPEFFKQLPFDPTIKLPEAEKNPNVIHYDSQGKRIP